jgi:hypothetical protein
MATKKQKQQKSNSLSKPEKCPQGLIVAGYVFAILGGFVGILIGWSIHDSKKTLSDGKRIYTYEQSDRHQGMIIFLVGSVIFSVGMILKLFGFY